MTINSKIKYSGWGIHNNVHEFFKVRKENIKWTFILWPTESLPVLVWLN